MTVRLVRGIEIVRIAKTAGFDSLYVDMEHSSFSLETTSQICMAALEAGITPFVRVPGPGDVQRILDAGALGIIAPHVQSAADARAYVRGREISAARRALQRRSAAPPAIPFVAGRAGLRGDRRRHHGDRAVREQRGDRAADEIVAVEGVDMVLIGTNDLLARLGPARPVRPSTGARSLRGDHRGLPPPRQARRRLAALPAGPISRPNMSAWAPVTSRPAPISASCSPPVPPRRRKWLTWPPEGTERLLSPVALIQPKRW